MATEHHESPSTFEVLSAIDSERLATSAGHILDAFRTAGITPIDAQIAAAETLADVRVWNLSYRRDGEPPFCWTWSRSPDSPCADDFSNEVIEVWRARAAQFQHPLLRGRYLDALWVFGGRRLPGRERPEAGRAAVRAHLELVESGLCDSTGQSIQRLRRALALAQSLNDSQLVADAACVMITWCGANASAHLEGTWSMVIDDLLERPRVALADDQVEAVRALIERMREDALSLLREHDAPPDALFRATAALARYHRRLGDAEAATVLVEEACQVVMSAVRVSQQAPFHRRYRLEQTRDFARMFENTSCADAAYQMIDEVAREMPEQMVRFSHTFEIEAERLDECVRELVADDLGTTLERVARAMLRRREQVTEDLRQADQSAPLFALFTLTTLDEDGRTVSRADTEATRVYHHLGHLLAGGGMLWMHVLSRVLREANARYLDVVDWLVGSVPFADLRRRQQLVEGIRAFFHESAIVAVHVLVPQIEHGLRQLAVAAGRSRLQRSNPSAGPNQLRTLDALLSDAGIIAVLGDDVVWYLRGLLIESAGLNIRNDVAHGLRTDGRIGLKTALYVFHVVILLGCVRIVRRDTESEVGAAGR